MICLAKARIGRRLRTDDGLSAYPVCHDVHLSSQESGAKFHHHSSHGLLASAARQWALCQHEFQCLHGRGDIRRDRSSGYDGTTSASHLMLRSAMKRAAGILARPSLKTALTLPGHLPLITRPPIVSFHENSARHSKIGIHPIFLPRWSRQLKLPELPLSPKLNIP